MPKIEVYRDALLHAIGARDLTDDQLEEIFPAAKAELDEPADESGLMKVELNDTNRPDLWSSAGLGRQLRVFRGGVIPRYDFFSTAQRTQDHGERRVIVDESVREIRPYFVGFVAQGPPINEAVLKDLIQTQEKLTWNYGQKRRAIAMGVHRSELIEFPVRYQAADPDSTRFVPLQMDRELSMREILTEHPKGQAFGHIVADQPRFPLLTENRGEVLSFPPVINSASIGAVKEGDTSLFVDLTGFDMESLLLSASIVACDFFDAGFTIYPTVIEYPFDTPYGREVTVPFYFQSDQVVSVQEVNKLLGGSLSADEIVAALERMGVESKPQNGTVSIRVPEYRNDFLHPVDIVEDVMIGRGMESFEPEMPRDFTVGRLTPLEEFRRRLRDLMVGLGFQEMIFNYLGSGVDFIDRMYPEESREAAYAETVRIANPMSENFEFVRPSIIPSLLNAERVSGNAVYPHRVFAIGKVAYRDETDGTGTRTATHLAYLTADGETDFNLVNSLISAILYYVGRAYETREASDPRFIPGRVAELRSTDGASLGVFGEVHPRVLEEWGVQVPCTIAEIDIERLMKADAGGRSEP